MKDLEQRPVPLRRNILRRLVEVGIFPKHPAIEPAPVFPLQFPHEQAPVDEPVGHLQDIRDEAAVDTLRQRLAGLGTGPVGGEADDRVEGE